MDMPKSSVSILTWILSCFLLLGVFSPLHAQYTELDEAKDRLQKIEKKIYAGTYDYSENLDDLQKIIERNTTVNSPLRTQFAWIGFEAVVDDFKEGYPNVENYYASGIMNHYLEYKSFYAETESRYAKQIQVIIRDMYNHVQTKLDGYKAALQVCLNSSGTAVCPHDYVLYVQRVSGYMDEGGFSELRKHVSMDLSLSYYNLVRDAVEQEEWDDAADYFDDYIGYYEAEGDVYKTEISAYRDKIEYYYKKSIADGITSEYNELKSTYYNNSLNDYYLSYEDKNANKYSGYYKQYKSEYFWPFFSDALKFIFKYQNFSAKESYRKEVYEMLSEGLGERMIVIKDEEFRKQFNAVWAESEGSSEKKTFLDELLMYEADAVYTIQAVQQYLDYCNECKYKDYYRGKLEDADKAAFLKASELNTEQALNEYLEGPYLHAYEYQAIKQKNQLQKNILMNDYSHYKRMANKEVALGTLSLIGAAGCVTGGFLLTTNWESFGEDEGVFALIGGILLFVPAGYLGYQVYNQYDMAASDYRAAKEKKRQANMLITMFPSFQMYRSSASVGAGVNLKF